MCKSYAITFRECNGCTNLLKSFTANQTYLELEQDQEEEQEATN